MFLSAREAKELEASANATSLVALRKPARRFHSNHWFHDGEYFVSFHANAALLRIVHHGDTIVVLANEAKFVRQLTNVAAFLLVLGLSPDGSARRLEVYEPAYLSVRIDADSVRWGSFASYGPGFVFDPSGAPETHFRAVRFGARNGRERRCHCGKLVDFVGRLGVRSSQWFKNTNEAEAMRTKAASLCAAVGSNITRLDPLGSSLRIWPMAPHPGSPRRLKLVVYQRNSNRKFADLEGLLRELARELQNHDGGGKSRSSTSSSRWHIEILTHDEDMQPCLLHRALRDADLFLSTHGFQATALMFMKPGATLLEVFPFRYWKDSYVALCAQFGIRHRWIQNQSPTSWSRNFLWLMPQSVCMQFNRCRSHARADNIAMPPSHVQFVLDTVREIERQVSTT